jgi:hypothetical protein
VTHFAVKRLTRSDLTFFEYQFRRQNAGNQKSINLNADVFIDDIFPYARTIAAGQPHQFPVPLQIFGPGLRRAPDNKTRKVIAAGGKQKNWRLNGEFVPDPDDDPTRYHGLAADDFAVFAFEEGRHQPVPESIAMALVSRTEPADAQVFADLQAFLTTRSMALLSAADLGRISAASPADHPIRELLDIEMDSALEDAALGSSDAIRKLRTRPSTRPIHISGTEVLAAAEKGKPRGAISRFPHYSGGFAA